MFFFIPLTITTAVVWHLKGHLKLKPNVTVGDVVDLVCACLTRAYFVCFLNACDVSYSLYIVSSYIRVHAPLLFAEILLTTSIQLNESVLH